MKYETILLAFGLATSSMAQAQDIKLTKVTPPWVTVEREGITTISVVISKSDNTDAKLQQLGKQLAAATRETLQLQSGSTQAFGLQK